MSAPGLARAAGAWAGGHPAAGPAGRGLVSGPAGQRLARAELSKSLYHPGKPLIERIEEAIARFLQQAQGAMPGGWWTAIALAALVVLVTAGIILWTGPVARARSRPGDPLLSPAGLSARDHRRDAERLAAEGDYSAAIIEIVRAIAVGLEERSVLPARVGRTAAEFAAEAGRALPGQAEALGAAARLFDDVRYGDRPGTAEGYRRLHGLDVAVQAARPRSPDGPGIRAGAFSPAGAAAGPVT